MKIIFWVLTVTTLVSATTQSKELVDVTINADMIHRNCINSSTINEFKALKENNFELSDASKKTNSFSTFIKLFSQSKT